jgi:hypothetical protein
MRIYFLSILTVLFALQASAESLKPGKYPKVYTGQEGLTVTVVPMMPKTANKAIVVVSGVDTEIDGLGIMHNIKKRSKGDVAYETTLHGEGFWTLYSEKSWGWKRYKVQLPESPMEKNYVYYDEKKSKKIKSSLVVDNYKRDQKKVVALKKWNRKERETRHNNGLKSIVTSVNKDCGTKIQASINWKSVTDEHLKEYSIYSFCGYPLKSISTLCRTDSAQKKKVTARINKVSCRFGKKMKLAMKSGSVMWTTNPDEGNQPDFTKNYFKNEFQ